MTKKQPKRGGSADNTFIRTYTGRFFWPLDPRADEVFIEDIAHSLSLQCRWTGHTREFYSIAQHSVLVSRNVPPEHALQGLLHDASEAYLSDLSRPIKHAPGLGETYKKVEKELERVIFIHFGLPTEIAPAVRESDNTVLWTERRDLLAPDRVPWTKAAKELAGTERLLFGKIVPWSSKEAETTFLQRYVELTGACDVLKIPAAAKSYNDPSLCSHCRHVAHESGKCAERVTDRAGDVDDCPCQTGDLKVIVASPASVAARLYTPTADRPSNSFTLTEYMTTNKRALDVAKREINGLVAQGKVTPARFSITKSNGQKQPVNGWVVK